MLLIVTFLKLYVNEPITIYTTVMMIKMFIFLIYENKRRIEVYFSELENSDIFSYLELLPVFLDN